MDKEILGIHHVTAIASDPQKNIDFYAAVLGLRPAYAMTTAGISGWTLAPADLETPKTVARSFSHLAVTRVIGACMMDCASGIGWPAPP